MKPDLYNNLKCLFLLLLLAAPATLFAQAGSTKQEAHPDNNISLAMVTASIAYVQNYPEPTQNQPAAEAEASCSPAFAAEVAKVMEKTYKVGNSDLLNIENKFGKVHVNTWKKNEIHVKVNIICRAATHQKAQELLDKITIVESRDGKTIKYRTELEPMRINNSNQQGFEINYTISMPDENPLTIKNSFGDVYLADFKGKADINVRYGSLKTEQMNNVSNVVKVAYGSASCKYINKGTIDMAYGNMNIEGTNGLQGSAKYGDFKIGSLNSSLDLNMKYGALRVDNISRNVSKINVTGGFSPMSLTFEDKATFNFDVNVQFGNFRYDKEQVTVTSLEKNHTSAAYKGNFGTASPKASVSIVSKYGDVKFTQ